MGVRSIGSKHRLRGAVILALLVAVVVITGTMLVPSAGARAGLAASTPRCPASSLSFVFVLETGASGKRFDTLALRNRGRTCHLWGYPGVAMLNSRGGLLRLNVNRRSRSEEPSRQVVLAPGHRAYFLLIFEDGGFCPGHSASAYGLQTYPPGSTRSLRLHRPRFEVCTSQIPAVGPVRATAP